MTDYEQLHLRNELAGILNDAQRNMLGHKMCINSAVRLYENCHSIEMMEDEIVLFMNRILVVGKKEIHIDRLVKFFGAFLAKTYGKHRSEPDEESILSSQEKTSKEATKMVENIIEYLLEITQAENKAIRWRATQILGTTINLLTGDPNDVLCEHIRFTLKQMMLIRVQDKNPHIRVAAIIALKRVHDPKNISDNIVKEYRRVLENDVQKEVRKAVIQHIGISKSTIPIFIERTKDIAVEVRKEVYRALMNTKHSQYSTYQLVTLLSNGLKDRECKVKKSCEKLISTFLRKTSLLSFLSALQPQNNQSLIESIIRFVISDKKFDFTEIEPTEEFAVEYTILRRIILQRAFENGESERYEDHMPEIYDICRQIIHAYQEEEMFDLKQLLYISVSLDYSNEAGRRHMSTMVRKILSEVKAIDIHPIAISLLRKLHPDESDFLQIILEILADVVDPLDTENTPTHPETDSEATDDIFVRALSICEEILRCTTKESSHGGIIGLLQNYILPSISHADCTVREKALSSLGLYCLLEQTEAAKYLLLFVKVIGSAEPDAVQLVAVRTLFDFLTCFGPEKMIVEERNWPEEFRVWNDESDEEEGSHAVHDARSFTLVALMRCLTQTRNTLIRSTAVEGFAKLLLNNFINDFQIISVLITLYFHPATDRDQTLTQCLGVFFPAFCLHSPKHGEIVKEAFIPTLERILGCSPYSPLRKVDIEKVVQFMIIHMDMCHTISSQPSVPLPGHDEMALGLSQIVLKNLNKNMEMSKRLCKVLGSMRIVDDDVAISKRLSLCMVRLTDKISEKPLVKVIESVQSALHKGNKKKRKSLSPAPHKPVSKRQRTKSPVRMDSEESEESDPEVLAIPKVKTRKRARSLSLRTSTSKTSPKKKQKCQEEQQEVVCIELDEEENAEGREDVTVNKEENGTEREEEEEEEEEELSTTTEEKVVISFSGFTMEDNVYNFTYLKSLVGDARKLGAELVLGNVINATITHIVSPPNRRTMKTIVGSLTNRWIVDPDWLTKSARAGKFLREELYGGKSSAKPFLGKNVWVSPLFLEENPNKQFNWDILQTLITKAGKGFIVEEEKKAHFVLCSKKDVRSTLANKRNKTYLNWKSFFEYLQPTVNIL